MRIQSPTNLALATIVLAAASIGCRSTAYPEGVYPCALASDCPPAWFCHADHLCWSAPEEDAAAVDAASVDASVVDAPPTDAPLADAPDTTAPDAQTDGCEIAPYFRDLDGDGYGDDADSIDSCGEPTGYVAAGGDCDDGCESCHPGGVEACDGANNDCDANVDEGTAGTACSWLCTAGSCDDVVEVAAGARHTCVRTMSGLVYCAGNNEFGQLGDGTVDHRDRFVAVAGLVDATDLSAGNDFTCAVRATGRIVCWGKNSQGQIGTSSATMAMATSPQVVPGLLTADEVECGGVHTCARTGTLVACWGFNAAGQLGNGGTTSTPTPTTVTTVGPATDLALGLLHTCAARTDGTVRCWGDGTSGQIGNGTTTGVMSPTDVMLLTGVTSIAAGAVSGHTCALRTGGEVWCWGENGVGQLGDATFVTPRTRPVRVTGLTGVTVIGAGSAHSCAADGSRTVCWGQSEGIADGTGFDRNTYTVAMGAPSLTHIAGGSGYTCGRAADARLYCWGSNDVGQLGDGTMTDRPTAISPLLPE